MSWFRKLFKKKNGISTIVEELEKSENVEILEKVEEIKTDEPLRCTAITKKGTRCTRKAVEGQMFCKQHLIVVD